MAKSDTLHALTEAHHARVAFAHGLRAHALAQSIRHKHGVLLDTKHGRVTTLRRGAIQTTPEIALATGHPLSQISGRTRRRYILVFDGREWRL